MSTIFCIDVETTGLNYKENGLIEIAILADVGNYIEDRLYIQIQPFDDDIINYENELGQSSMSWKQFKHFNMESLWNCLVIPHQKKVGDLRTGLSSAEAIDKITAFFDKFINKYDIKEKAFILGYNVRFDLDFLSEFFRKCDNNYLGSYINWRLLDPLYLMWTQSYNSVFKNENFKLETIAKAFRLEHYPHNALSDIEVTRRIWYKFRPERLIEDCVICGKRGDKYSMIHDNWYCNLCYEVNVAEMR